MALYVTVYMSLMGNQGLKEVNALSYSNAHYLADRLVETGKFELAFPDKPFLHEFAVKYHGNIDELQKEMLSYGIQFGLKLDDETLLLCATETLSADEIDEAVCYCESIVNA